jgi:tetratricopeptide (TPR) repeat protein
MPYNDQGRYDLAIKDLDRAIELNPDDRNAARIRGEAYAAAQSIQNHTTPSERQIPSAEVGENTTIVYSAGEFRQPLQRVSVSGDNE